MTKKMDNKKIIIDLTKEEEEEKELIELLEGKKNENNNKINNKNNCINNIKNNYKVNNNFKNENSNIYKLDIKENICKKIGNYYSNGNINNINRISKKKEKEKNKIIILNKQKVISANTSSMNSHVSRLLNLKKIKSQNNINDNNFKENKYDSFNKNNRKELKNLKNDKYVSQKNSISTRKKMLYNSQYNIQYNKDINDDTPSISILAYTKKYITNSNNSQNITDNNNKYRVGLLSAYSNSSKNILIPLVSLQRPLSNFNIGGELNIDNINNEKINKETSQIKMNLIKKYEQIRQNVNTAPLRKKEKYNYLIDAEQKNFMNKKYNNLFGNINLYRQKYHHIKIDRSLINKKMKESFYKSKVFNYMNLHKGKFPKIKNNYNYYEVKRLFNSNNSSKNI